MPDALSICALMPITRPEASNSGPPELPRLIGASVWIAFAIANPDVSESIERPVAETTPTESDVCWPNGLPIAATGSPTTTAEESPSGVGSSAWSEGVTRNTPTSLKRSQPTIFASTRSRSENSTYTALAPLTARDSVTFVITCAFVRIRPSRSTTKPEPCEVPSAPRFA